MIGYPIVKKALEFVTIWHKGQVDDNGDNYVGIHLIPVATILSMLCPNDPNLIAAGLLHDVIEDTEITEETVRGIFGDDIADLVMEVTKDGEKDEWGYFFPRLHSQRGITLKFVDRLSNLARTMPWDEERAGQYLKRSRFWKTRKGECPTCHGSGQLGEH